MLGENMFNTEAFQHDIQQRSVPNAAAQVVDSGKRAMLYVFTPTIIPSQFLRPYQYNFNGNLVDEIVTAKERLNCAVAPNGLGLSSDLVNKSILPTASGIPIDTTGLQTQYTFVLVADTSPSVSTRRSALSPTTRLIATGFCTDEPINMHSIDKSINPSAILMFTKTNTSYISPTMGSFGIENKVSSASDLDVVNEMNGLLANQDLFLATPQDIRSTVFSGGVNSDGTIMGAYGELCLNNVKQNESGKLISGALKTPKIQLGQIMQALDRSIDYTTALNDGFSSNIGPDVMPDMAETARSAFDQNVAGSRQPLPRSGIDTSRPISMADLVYMFPNLDIIPIEIPLASAWDSTPQDAMTARNSMSSMLSASLSNLVPSCGLADIMFRYSSYATVGPSVTTSQYGVWKIDKYDMLVPCPQHKEESAVITFQNYFEMELAPILKVVRGDFDLFAYVDVMGYILIDLVFKDDHLTMNQYEGFYETSSRLGGLLNPMVADLGVLNHNAIQLDTLVTDTIDKKLGPTRHFSPIIETPDSAVPYGTYPGNKSMMVQQPRPAGPAIQAFQSKEITPQTNFDYSSLI